MPAAFNRVANEDCVGGLKQMAEGSVDLVFADPPFNIGYDYDLQPATRKRVRTSAAQQKLLES